MGNIGGIEKIMVFGILVIIVVILGIAFYSAVKVDDDLMTPNSLKAAGGSDNVIRVLDHLAKNDAQENPETGSAKRTFKDVGVQDTPEPQGMEHLKKNEVVEEEEREPKTQPGMSETVATEDQEKPSEQVEVQEALIDTYKIKSGDTLMQIARVLYGDESRWYEILNVNPNLDTANLQVGMVIKLPEPISATTGMAVEKKKEKKPSRKNPNQRSYIVQAGDNLAKISEKFYGSRSQWKKIWDANRDIISDPDVLKVGMELDIP